MRIAVILLTLFIFILLLLPAQDDQLAPYYPTPQIVVDKMLQLGGLKAGEKMFDLGSVKNLKKIIKANSF